MWLGLVALLLPTASSLPTTSAATAASAGSRVDIVLFGATGFTGRLAAEWMKERYGGTDLTWALAGRNEAKLESLRAELGRPDVPIIVADASDATSVEAMVSRASVVANYAGTPFLTKALPVVEACSRLGVHYVDITGETALHRESFARYDAAARASGACVVHSCGYDSVPSDLGYLLASDAYRRRFGAAPRRVRYLSRGFSGGASGGSIYTGLALFGLAPELMDANASELVSKVEGRYPLSPDGVCGPDTRDTVFRPEWDAVAGAWVLPFIMAAANAPVVRKTQALLGGDYVPYDEVQAYEGSRVGALASYATFLGSFAAMLFPPSRYCLKAYVLPKPGEGPDKASRDSGFFHSEIYAHGPEGTVSAHVRSGVAGDGGYKATALMALEAALGLIHDASGPGVLTPATALGYRLVDRLNAAGMRLSVDA